MSANIEKNINQNINNPEKKEISNNTKEKLAFLWTELFFNEKFEKVDTDKFIAILNKEIPNEILEKAKANILEKQITS